MAQGGGSIRRTLFPPERQDAILRLTREQGRADVAQLAESFAVTTETIRRDLSDLQRRRLVRRVHGGAILWDADGFEPLLSSREGQRVDQKRRIAAAAVLELPPEGSVILDSGSTTAWVARLIPADFALTVVTNSPLITQVLAEHELVRVIVLGGQLDKNTMTIVDQQTVAAVHELTVDALILGTDGVSASGGLTTPYRNHAELKRAMIGAARRVVTLADHTKIARDHFIRFAACREMDILITDTEADDEATAQIEACGTTVMRV